MRSVTTLICLTLLFTACKKQKAAGDSASKNNTSSADVEVPDLEGDWADESMGCDAPTTDKAGKEVLLHYDPKAPKSIADELVQAVNCSHVLDDNYGQDLLINGKLIVAAGDYMGECSVDFLYPRFADVTSDDPAASKEAVAAYNSKIKALTDGIKADFDTLLKASSCNFKEGDITKLLVVPAMGTALKLKDEAEPIPDDPIKEADEEPMNKQWTQSEIAQKLSCLGAVTFARSKGNPLENEFHTIKDAAIHVPENWCLKTHKPLNRGR